MKIRRLTVKDFIKNICLKTRFDFYRAFEPHKLSTISPLLKPGYTLTFFDNFHKKSWGSITDKEKWIVGEGWGAFHPQNQICYFDEPEIRNSEGIFSVKYKPKEFEFEGKKIVIPFAVSWLSSLMSYKQQYGRFECRMTLPKEKGTWPAFWLWGPTWPPEIDVIEAYGRKDGKSIINQEINLHYRFDDNIKSQMRAWKIKVDNYDENLNERYHEFVVEWRPNIIEFYTDGIKVFEYTNPEVLKTFNLENLTQHIVINHNLQRFSYIKPEEYENYYSEFKVDYIRAYKIDK